ncbi:MAG: hypothetical protein ABI882_09395 [Acidobacteriota bacterium]
MATKHKPGSPRRGQPAHASTLGSTRMPPIVRDALIHPDSTPLRVIPKDETVEVLLSKVEDLLGKGHYGVALRELNALKISKAPLASEYEFISQDKRARANLGIADRYFIRGDAANARKFYQQAIALTTNDSTVKSIGETAVEVFDSLVRQRTELLHGLQENILANKFDQWCGQKRDLFDFTLLDHKRIRERVAPDYFLERVFGERSPIVPSPGYLDALPLETDFIDLPSSLPGSVFRSASSTALGQTVPAVGADLRLRASVAMPLVANIMLAKMQLFALDAGLNIAGQASGTVPLFRYDYLRDRARQTIAHIQQVESRMLPIQFELDDFAEVVDAIRRPLAEQEAELQAINQRIRELIDAYAALTQAEAAMTGVVVLLHKVEDECDCDWLCWLVGIADFVAAAAILVAAIALTPATLGAALALALVASIGVDTFIALGAATLSCQSVQEFLGVYEPALTGMRQGIREVEAELTHALMRRDVLIASINALSQELSEVYQSNSARVLDARTLDLIQSQYNSIRQSLLTRAQALAAIAQDAFNFERDMELHLIRDVYSDQDRKDYTAAETLLRDLDGLDYVDVTGRTQKAMQLSHVVSLRKHYPVSFLTLRLTGGTRFTTSLKEFDRWFPGTHLQRIKEIRVEVVVDGQTVPVRGYLSNDGVSMVRFQDAGNKRRVDGVHVFAEPDPDMARLCYKRLQRRRHMDTMAFPGFDSYLHEDRMRKLQDKERNFFENAGLESTWKIEFLPDQPVDISNLTDVFIHFQYEALFDENLKRLLEKKRYDGRREMGKIPIRQTLIDEGKPVDLTGTVLFVVPVHLLEAPVLERKIVNVGFIVKPKEGSHLEGSAKLEVAYDGATPVLLVTNEVGVVATSTGHPLGTGLAELEAMAHGKSLDKVWEIRIAELPGGLSADAIDEIFLLLNYEYAS